MDATIFADGLMTVTQVARLTSLSRSKVYELMDNGILLYRLIAGKRRTPKRAVMAYLEAEFADEPAQR